MRKIVAIVLLFIFLGIPTKEEKPNQFIVWNVGQGLWTTLIRENGCAHFDAGGEKKYFTLIFPKLKKLCSTKNFFSFSHWDLDHISFVGRLAGKTASCVLNLPGGEPTSVFKKRWLAKLKPCQNQKGTNTFSEVGKSKANTTSNEASRIYIYDGKVLLPGDASIKSEKIWLAEVPTTIQFLVLGHHGSRTSTGLDLLERLTNLSTTIASSNSARYGHPHQEVKNKLKKYGKALLETQFWGNIHIVLNEKRYKNQDSSL